jgi:hypothetical protein
VATEWRQIRVPAELADRLAAMAEDLMEAHQAGRTRLPNEFVERVPLHFVITRALDDWEAHKARSNVRKREKVGS